MCYSMTHFKHHLRTSSHLRARCGAATRGAVRFRFHWKREGISASLVTIDWTIPDNAPGGWYTIHYSHLVKDTQTVVSFFGWNNIFKMVDLHSLCDSLKGNIRTLLNVELCGLSRFLLLRAISGALESWPLSPGVVFFFQPIHDFMTHLTLFNLDGQQHLIL